jgi:hypothetical protein
LASALATAGWLVGDGSPAGDAVAGEEGAVPNWRIGPPHVAHAVAVSGTRVLQRGQYFMGDGPVGWRLIQRDECWPQSVENRVIGLTGLNGTDDRIGEQLKDPFEACLFDGEKLAAPDTQRLVDRSPLRAGNNERDNSG